ncbi:hypothetical protein JKI95_07635 [Corynebacterium aquatimens]|uniref:hypothetical protein n=1 Tax=Corynebacterium aquatimens TaxID=1190508 RepID=UPI00254221B8|nr:hypothetical protein [Corynebacterium aquatimens]QYH19119.1 hypothetical protein JKI95_07635 [Corynebacterium aquatimens]
MGRCAYRRSLFSASPPAGFRDCGRRWRNGDSDDHHGNLEHGHRHHDGNGDAEQPRASGGAALPPADGDRPAREVETIPNQATAFTPAEEAFLEDLREHGLNVEGVEDQLTATGFSVCSNDVITRDAVAGQLVEQRRTDMDPAALAELLTDTARANLC